MHPSPINQPCRVCGRATTQWCSRCQTTWYCSTEHARGDWGRHREECRPASHHGYGTNMIATPPPAEPQSISVSGILFLAEEDRPRVVTIKCSPSHHRPSNGCPIPYLQPYFDSPPESVVLTQGLNGEPLRFPLHIFYSPIALAQASPINGSIYHITSGAAPKSWAGTVVVLKFNGARRQGYTDAGVNDLPALSAYFLTYQ